MAIAPTWKLPQPAPPVDVPPLRNYRITGQPTGAAVTVPITAAGSNPGLASSQPEEVEKAPAK